MRAKVNSTSFLLRIPTYLARSLDRRDSLLGSFSFRGCDYKESGSSGVILGGSLRCGGSSRLCTPLRRGEQLVSGLGSVGWDARCRLGVEHIDRAGLVSRSPWYRPAPLSVNPTQPWR
jgi:hypothetical protein